MIYIKYAGVSFPIYLPLDEVPSVTYLIAKLVNIGIFPSAPPTSRSQPSFFQTTLPTIRSRFNAERSTSYPSFWSEMLLSLPSTFTLQTILVSLFSSLSEIIPSADTSSQQRALVKQEAVLLHTLVSPLTSQNSELWECVSAVILGREWSEGHARIFVCWVAGAGVRAPDKGGKYIVISSSAS